MAKTVRVYHRRIWCGKGSGDSGRGKIETDRLCRRRL